VTVVMSAVTALLGLLLVGAVSVGGVLIARTQAIVAADAAALAAAVATHPDTGRLSPVQEARRVAGANGAQLVACECPVNASLGVREVTVTVAIDIDVPIFGSLRLHGRSRAEFDPMAWLGR